MTDDVTMENTELPLSQQGQQQETGDQEITSAERTESDVPLSIPMEVINEHDALFFMSNTLAEPGKIAVADKNAFLLTMDEVDAIILAAKRANKKTPCALNTFVVGQERNSQDEDVIGYLVRNHGAILHSRLFSWFVASDRVKSHSALKGAVNLSAEDLFRGISESDLYVSRHYSKRDMQRERLSFACNRFKYGRWFHVTFLSVPIGKSVEESFKLSKTASPSDVCVFNKSLTNAQFNFLCKQTVMNDQITKHGLTMRKVIDVMLGMVCATNPLLISSENCVKDKGLNFDQLVLFPSNELIEKAEKCIHQEQTVLCTTPLPGGAKVRSPVDHYTIHKNGKGDGDVVVAVGRTFKRSQVKPGFISTANDIANGWRDATEARQYINKFKDLIDSSSSDTTMEKFLPFATLGAALVSKSSTDATMKIFKRRYRLLRQEKMVDEHLQLGQSGLASDEEENTDGQEHGTEGEASGGVSSSETDALDKKKRAKAARKLHDETMNKLNLCKPKLSKSDVAQINKLRRIGERLVEKADKLNEMMDDEDEESDANADADGDDVDMVKDDHEHAVDETVPKTKKGKKRAAAVVAAETSESEHEDDDKDGEDVGAVKAEKKSKKRAKLAEKQVSSSSKIKSSIDKKCDEAMRSLAKQQNAYARKLEREERAAALKQVKSSHVQQNAGINRAIFISSELAEFLQKQEGEFGPLGIEQSVRPDGSVCVTIVRRKATGTLMKYAGRHAVKVPTSTTTTTTTQDEPHVAVDGDGGSDDKHLDDAAVKRRGIGRVEISALPEFRDLLFPYLDLVDSSSSSTNTSPSRSVVWYADINKCSTLHCEHTINEEAYARLQAAHGLPDLVNVVCREGTVGGKMRKYVIPVECLKPSVARSRDDIELVLKEVFEIKNPLV